MEASVLLELIAGPAFGSDEAGRIVLWNAGAERLFGYGASEVAGQRCWEVLQGTDPFGNRYCLNHCNPLRMFECGEPIHDFEIDVRKASGEMVRVSFSLVVERGESPSQFTVVHIMRTGPLVPERASATSKLGTASPTHQTELVGLSRREVQVLVLVSEGVGTREIAHRLSVSPATIRSHVQNILRKIGAHSKLEAVAIARREGIL
jgi:PAS domain S-box-containing protein